MIASKTQHKTIPNPALPYVTNTSPTSAAAQWVGGANCLTSIKGQLERRPGFGSSLETVPVTLGSGETIIRTFLWSKWNNQHYAMISTIDGTHSYVYKYAIGHDVTATKIHTCSTSTTPFWYTTANDKVYFGNETDMKLFDASSTADVTAHSWGFSGPASAPTMSTGGTGITGNYFYVYTFWDDTRGHESSPSPKSAVVSPSNQTVTVTVSAAGADSRVTHFKIYRCPTQSSATGSPPAASTFQLVSKQVIGTTTYADSTTDANLGTEFCPGENMNDPPPASRVGCYAQGRVWLYTGATVWATAYEESSKGVPEESVPGGSLGVLGGGNAWNWDRPVKGVQPTTDGVAIFTPLRIYGIQGDSLDTFRIYRILDNRGATSDANIAAFANDIVWFDTSGQVWHSQIGEIGQDIRPSIVGIDQTQSAIVVHISGTSHHIYLMDGANAIIYPFDIDTRQWMPPWNIGSTSSAIWSGETSVGTVDLLVARNKAKLLKQTTSAYNDDGNTYSASAKLGLVHISQTSELTERYDRSNPAWRGVVDWIELKTNTSLPSDVLVLNDDDPNKATGTSLVSYARDPDDVAQGTYVNLKRYPCSPAITANAKSDTGRMTSVTINWPSADANFQLYYVDIAFHPYAS